MLMIPKILKLHITGNVINKNILSKIKEIVDNCHLRWADVIGAKDVNNDIIEAISKCHRIRYNIKASDITSTINKLPNNVDLCIDINNYNGIINYDKTNLRPSFSFSCITAEERNNYLSYIETITGIKPILTFETDDVQRYFYEKDNCQILVTQKKYIDANNNIYSAKYTDEGKILNNLPSENRCPYFLLHHIVLDTDGNIYYCEGSNITFDNINNYETLDLQTVRSIYNKQKAMWDYNRKYKDVLIDKCPNCIYRTIMTEQVVESLK